MAFYVDTSALAKLVVSEAGTEALRHWLAERRPNLVACDLARTELMRVVRRAAPDRLGRASEVLDAITVTQVTPAIFEAAGRLDPMTLRTLDAIHLAAALDLGPDLEGVVCYDEWLAASAEVNGIAVVAPA